MYILYMCSIKMILLHLWFANRGNVDLAESSSRVAKAFLEIKLKKKSTARWTGLEKPRRPGTLYAMIITYTCTTLSSE